MCTVVLVLLVIAIGSVRTVKNKEVKISSKYFNKLHMQDSTLNKCTVKKATLDNMTQCLPILLFHLIYTSSYREPSSPFFVLVLSPRLEHGFRLDSVLFVTLWVV